MGRPKLVKTILKHPNFDCYAYRSGECATTLVDDCAKYPFYKTQEQFDAAGKTGKQK